MNHMSNDELEKLSNDLTDGKVINWSKVNKVSGAEQSVLNQLNAIEKIANVFASNHQQSINNKQNTQAKQKHLFEWGHLQVVEKIGEGSFGQVYRAYDPILERNVALKIFKQDCFSSLQSRAFIQEAKRLAKVRNENVLAIHGANIYENNAGMWSDLIAGFNLSDKQFKKQLNEKELLNILSSISKALIAVHQSDLVHGDIKPSNIMFQKEDNKYILMDFGAGRTLDETSKNNQTFSASISGTPLFMAPELFTGTNSNDNNISTASDIYAFGVLLYLLATGTYPIKGNNIADIYTSHDKKLYTPLSTQLDELSIKLPKSLRKLIQEMLAFDPGQRPNAQEILNRHAWIISTPIRLKKRVTLLFIFSILMLGTAFTGLGFYRAKIAQNITLREMQKAETVNQFLQNMLSSTAKTGLGKETRIVDMLNSATKDVNEISSMQPIIKAATLEAIGLSYHHLGMYQKSNQLYLQSLDLKKQWLKQDNPELLRMSLQIGVNYSNLNQVNKSLEIYQKVLQHATQKSKNNEAIILLATTRLAGIHQFQGKNTKAINTYLEVLNKVSVGEKSLKHSKSNKHKYMNIRYLALLGLANTYLYSSDYKKSKRFAILALNEFNTQSGSFISNKLATQNILSISLTHLGEFNAAEEISDEMIEVSEKYYGVYNINYINQLSNYAGMLSERGQLDKALDLQLKAVEYYSETQDKNPQTFINLNTNLANTKVSLGLLKEGELLMRKTLTQSISYLGESHMDTLILEYNLAELLNKNKKHTQAQQLATINHIKMEKTLGATHLYTLLSQDNIAVSLHGQKKINQAQVLFEKLLLALAVTVGTKSPYLLLVQKHYVTLLIDSKQLTLALTQLDKLIQLQLNLYGENHPDLIQSLKLKENLINK